MEAETEASARAEFWKAIVSQLKMRMTSMEASGELEQCRIEEIFCNEFIMTAKGGYLSVWLHTDTGEGSWNSISEKLDKAEPWFMSVDGSVELRGENMDLATAAQRFIEMVS